MILLSGQTLTAQEKFRPESMSLTLEERKSQASMTVGPEAPAISVGDWMRDDTEPGAGILWRVKSVSEQIEKQTRTIGLEHICNTLRDYVIFGEWEPENGCTAKAAMEYAVSQTGGLWQIGAWETSNPTNPYKFASTSVMSALETVSASLSGAFWEYDLNAIPFTLHIRLIPDAAASEMRMSRNITSLRKSIDRSRMYTRIYPIGADDLHLTGNGYLTKNESTYGRVDHIETDQSKESEAELQRWAQERLNTHCEPSVSIQIGGLDYSQATGESLDALRIGKKCRVPLPEYGTTILETVTRLQYKDKIAKPEEVTVNLANIQEDVASIFRKSAGSAASNTRAGGRGSKKQKEEDHAWFVDTTEHVAMVAEAIIGRAEGETSEHMWSRVSAIVVDGTGLHGRVTANEEGIAMHGTAIEANENAISLAVGTYQINPDKILRYNGISNFPATGQTGWYYVDTSVTPNRTYIWKGGQYNLLQVSQDGEQGFLIKAGEIALAINESGESTAVIDADKVIIGRGTAGQEGLPAWMQATDGLIADKATITQLNALSARVGTLEADTITTTMLSSNTMSAYYLNISSGIQIQNGATLLITSGGSFSAPSSCVTFSSGNSTVSPTDFVTDVQIAANGTNGYKLQYKTAFDQSWTDAGTFSRATLASGSWSGATYTVAENASGQALPISQTMYQQIEGTASPTATAYAKMYHTDPTAAANQVGSALEMTLSEDVSNKKVKLLVNTLTKAEVSTSDTFDAGVLAGEGHFTPESVTKQGNSCAAYVVDNSSGVQYYLKDSSVSAYAGNGQRYGTATRYTRSGNIKLKKWGTGTLYPNPSGTGGMNHTWWYEDSGGTNYYQTSSETVWIKNGNGDVYSRGDSITVIHGTAALKLKSVTRYEAGSAATYYKKTT